MAAPSLHEAQAKTLVHAKGRSRREQLWLLLAVGNRAKSVDDIRHIAVRCGLRSALRWNISDILRKSNGYAILTSAGWELTEAGFHAVADMSGIRTGATVVAEVAADVRQHLADVSSSEAREFIEEAIWCFEHGKLRPAVVFSWVGAVSIMHAYVVKRALLAFNEEARRRDARWKPARNTDELGRMKEHDFLDVMEAIGLIGKNVKQVLQNQCLNLRNACGHPSTLRISNNNVAAHLDTLVLNAYSRFS